MTQPMNPAYACINPPCATRECMDEAGFCWYAWREVKEAEAKAEEEKWERILGEM